MKRFALLLALLTTQQNYNAAAFTQTAIHKSDGNISLIAQTPDISEEESKLKAIITTGFGTDADSATRNAAENALNEVVGSIISSEKLLEKKTVISNGIKEQTKLIKTNIVDYSQGSLKSVKVLDVKQSNGLYAITVKAVVRIEDFTRFIEKLAKDKRKIDKGIFAGVQANRDNITTKFTQLKKTIGSIPAGKAQEIKVGEAFLAGERFSSFIDRNWSPQETIVVPVEIRLKPDYIKELTRTLQSMAIERDESIVSQSDRTLRDLNDSLRRKVNDQYGYAKSRRGLYISFAERSGSSWIGNSYFLPNLKTKTNGVGILPKDRDLKITLLDRDSFPVKQSKFNRHGLYGYHRSRDIWLFRPSHRDATDLNLKALIPESTSYHSVFKLSNTNSDGDIFIYGSVNFFIFLNLTSDETDQIENIIVEFQK